MERKYLLHTPCYSVEFINKCYQLRMDLYVLLRNKVLKNDKFPWQEVCLFLDCIIIMHEHLLIDKNKIEYNDSRIADWLNQLYQGKYRESINKRFEKSKLYSVPNFDSLLKHFQEEGKLGNATITLIEEIQNRQNRVDNYNPNNSGNFNQNDFEDFKDYVNGYTPYKCLRKLKEDNVASDMDTLIIKRNSKHIYFTVEITSAFCDQLNDIDALLGKCDLSDINYSGAKVFKDASCIWSFSNGYARALSQNGIWGYISQETNEINWIDENVKYAYDFKCERARVVLNNEKYYFLDLCLNNCFKKEFLSASDYYNGIALVSDEYCNSYRIDVHGNIIPDDIEKYENSKRQHFDSIKQTRELLKKNRRNSSSYDEESAIMNSLSGYGPDPEVFGF